MTTCTCPFNEKGRFALDICCPVHGQKAIVQTPAVAATERCNHSGCQVVFAKLGVPVCSGCGEPVKVGNT